MLAAIVVLPLLACAVLWPLTPGVGDASHRVAQDLAAHGQHPLPALPVPDRVGQAVIATENSRFYHDPGIDPLGAVRAVRGFVLRENVGAATLEQQLAKRLYTPRDGFTAQIADVELSVKLDVAYSKRVILRMYLSDAYYGHGFYGLDAATRGYFGQPPNHLTWAQASLLAGLVQAPSAYDPYRHLDRAKRRQRHVLSRLVATGVLTRAEADAAYAAPLNLRPVAGSAPVR